MSTAEEIEKVSCGAQWLKVDLHVHTPASSDMAERWKGACPEDVVRIAQEKQLDAIAITDHNTAMWCDRVRKAAEGTPLTVFPGVEISTHQGHILAIFDTDVSATAIEDLLIKVGFDRDKFGSLDFATEKGIVDVSNCISEADGVAVAAHADGPRGFLKVIETGAERKRAYCAQNLRALEILDATSRDGHQSGSKHGRKLACIQSSDCSDRDSDHHELNAMANRYTFLKMDARSLSGLKLALIDPDIRVRLSRDDPQSPDNVILGMWVTGGFLAAQKIRFNDSVNCLIGDTGSGKSVATELLRFGLDQQARVRKIQDEVQGLLAKQLGDLNVVHILLAKNGIQYLVERNWGSPPGAPLVRRVTESGLEPIGEIDMRQFFPIKGFSQSEIIEFARESEVRLSLTDDLIDFSKQRASIQELRNRLKKNAADVTSQQAEEHSKLNQLAARDGLEESLKSLDKFLTDERVVQQRLWDKEQTLFDSAKEQVERLTKDTSKFAETLSITLALPDDVDSFPSQELLEKLKKIYHGWQSYITDLQDGAEVKLRDLECDLKKLRKEWCTHFSKAVTEYQQLLQLLDTEGVGLQALSDRHKYIRGEIERLDEINRELQCETLPRIKRLEKEREELLSNLQECRRDITDRRKLKAKQLSQKLNQKISLKVHARDNKSAFRESLQHIAQGSRVYSAELATLADKCHPVPFVKMMLARDFDCLATASGIEASKLEKILDTIVERDRMAELYDLQLTDVDDVIEVMLLVEQGQYRRLEDLSHGQKCMVVLMVALAEGSFPLLVDQPEDALHAPSIEEGIVSTLRSGRGARQCIFATRNANILVSADAEQIIALKADANSGEVAGTGSLDRFSQRELIIYHVEGGEEAFRRRKTMYTLEPSP